MSLIDRGAILSIVLWAIAIACLPGAATMILGHHFRDIYGIRRTSGVSELSRRVTSIRRNRELMVTTNDWVRTAILKLSVETWFPCRNETQRFGFLKDVQDNPWFNTSVTCNKPRKPLHVVATIELGSHRFLRRSDFLAINQPVPSSDEPLECAISVTIPESAVPWNILVYAQLEVIPTVSPSDCYPDAVRSIVWSIGSWFADVLLVKRKNNEQDL